MANTQQSNDEVNACPTRVQLYVRLGFGALVGFGAAGSCTGRQSSAATVLGLVAVIWCLTRIVTEALDAWRRLYPPQPPGEGMPNLRLPGPPAVPTSVPPGANYA